MYLSKIELKDIKCFEKFTLDLKDSGGFTFLTTILGDNAVGKSTILKAIAMGLNDEVSAGALMKESPGEMLRTGTLKGHIKLTLDNNKRESKTVITTRIFKDNLDDPERIKQEKESDNEFNWKDIFVCGYGVNRTIGGDTSFEKYTSLESTYTLFNKLSGLQNSELILLRQSDIIKKIITDKLLRILMLDQKHYSIEFTKKGMMLNGPWGSFTISDMSDGYQSTTSWVTDFFGWQIYADRIVNKDSLITGILLIDEIENHLHPRWQKNIIQLLKEQLPNVQIIVSTHSPLIAKSAGSLTPNTKTDKLVYLELTEGNKVEKTELELLKGMDIDQILASKAFGYQILNIEEDEILSELSRLTSKGENRNKKEEEKYKFAKELAKNFIFSTEKSLFEQELESEINKKRQQKIQELEKKLFEHS